MQLKWNHAATPQSQLTPILIGRRPTSGVLVITCSGLTREQRDDAALQFILRTAGARTENTQDQYRWSGHEPIIYWSVTHSFLILVFTQHSSARHHGNKQPRLHSNKLQNKTEIIKLKIQNSCWVGTFHKINIKQILLLLFILLFVSNSQNFIQILFFGLSHSNSDCYKVYINCIKLCVCPHQLWRGRSVHDIISEVTSS